MIENDQESEKKLLESIEPQAKFWLEYEGAPLVGPGRAGLLEAIINEGSLVHAANNSNISFRAAWDRVKKIERRLDIKITQSKKGGEGGGGTTQLTEAGKQILQKYKRLEAHMGEILTELSTKKTNDLRIDAHNKLKGSILKINQDEYGTTLEIRIDTPIIISSIIPRKTAKNLNLNEGKVVEVHIKSTAVQIGKKDS